MSVSVLFSRGEQRLAACCRDTIITRPEKTKRLEKENDEVKSFQIEWYKKREREKVSDEKAGIFSG